MGKVVRYKIVIPDNGRDRALFDTVGLVKSLMSVVSRDGGCYTVAALARKLDAKDAFKTNLSDVAKTNLVKRVLELSEAIRKGRTVHAFIGINTASGKLDQRRPRGVTPAGDEVIFEPQ